MGERNCCKKEVAECIKKKAYELWEKDGRKKGCDLHYWLDAGYLDNNRQRQLQPVYLLPQTHVWLKQLNRLDLEAVMECTL